MPRVILTVPKKMKETLDRESARTNAPISALVREAIEEWAKKRGLDAPDTTTWGGPRRQETEEEETEGQGVAYSLR